jgi:hypothetical protein
MKDENPCMRVNTKLEMHLEQYPIVNPSDAQVVRKTQTMMTNLQHPFPVTSSTKVHNSSLSLVFKLLHTPGA